MSFAINEKEKSYNERILQVENGTFTPLVFAANGAMGVECEAFYKRLAEMISEKRDTLLSLVTNFIRTKICFSLLRSTIRCIRGSRGINDPDVRLHDIGLANRAIIRNE